MCHQQWESCRAREPTKPRLQQRRSRRKEGHRGRRLPREYGDEAGKRETSVERGFYVLLSQQGDRPTAPSGRWVGWWGARCHLRRSRLKRGKRVRGAGCQEWGGEGARSGWVGLRDGGVGAEQRREAGETAQRAKGRGGGANRLGRRDRPGAGRRKGHAQRFINRSYHQLMG